MHIFIGIGALVAVFWGATQFIEEAFKGYWNVTALILVGGGPYAISLLSFDPRSLFDAVRVLVFALRFSGGEDQRALMRDVYRFGRLVREGKTADAGRFVASNECHPFLRDLGGLVLQRSTPEAIADTVGTVAYARAARVKRAEEVFMTLGRVAPAMGMTGTVIGMIQLLSHLEKFDKLGAGMAVAMVATLYGLIGQHAVYTPLARKIDVYGRRLTVNMRLLERGLVAVATQRPLHDLKLLAGETEGVESAADAREEVA